MKRGGLTRCIIEKPDEKLCVMAVGDSLLTVVTQVEAKPGLVFIVMGSGGFESSSFFIFPFFFFSTSDPVSMLIVLAFVFIMIVFMIRSTSIFFGQTDLRYENGTQQEYLRVGSKCDYCLHPLPEKADFCPSCGTPVAHDRNSNH